MNLAYLSLGSNIEPESNLRRAAGLLARVGEVRVVSGVYETAPVGLADQPNFMNAAVLLATPLSAAELKYRELARIERQLKRERTANKYAPRTIDVDISLFNHDILTLGQRAIPDPAILMMAHIAVPLADLDPDYVHPLTGETLAAIAARLRSQTPLKLRQDVTLRQREA